MAPVGKHCLHAGHADNVILHVGARQKLLDGGAVVNDVVAEGLVQAVLLDGIFVRRTSGHAVEVVDDEAQLLVGEVGQVGSARLLLKDGHRPFGFELADIGVRVFGHQDNLLAVIAGDVVVQVAVQVGNGGKGKVHRAVIATQVDAVFLEVEGGGDRCGRHLLSAVADEGGAVKIDIVHALLLYQAHQVGEGHVVIGRELLGGGIYHRLRILVLESILTIAGLGDGHLAARKHQRLEVSHGDVGHRRQVIVETEGDGAAVLTTTVHRHLLGCKRSFGKSTHCSH